MLSVAALASLFIGEPVGAQPVPAATLTPAADLCPVFVGRIDRLDADGSRYAVGLVTYGGTGSVSGSLAVYDGDKRYEVPFERVRAIDPTDPKAHPQPLVVRFAQPVTIDGAVVDALGPAPRRPCTTPYQPWTKNGPLAPVVGHEATVHASGIDPSALARRYGHSDVFDEDALWKSFDADAAQIEPVDAGPAVAAPMSCPPNTDEKPHTLRAGEAFIPATYPGGVGVVDVLVTIGSDHSLITSAILSSSGNRDVDRSVLDAVKRSGFTAGQFRCAPAAGSYVFSVIMVD
jgi:TonB family protein